MQAQSSTTPPVFRGSRRRASWIGTSRPATTGTSAWASRFTSEPLAQAVALPFRLLPSEGDRSARRAAILALALSLALHGLGFGIAEIALPRIRAVPAQNPPIPVTLIVEQEDAPSEVAPPAPSAPSIASVRSATRPRSRHRVGLPNTAPSQSTPIESAPPA